MKENKKPKVRLWMSLLLSVIVLSVVTGCGGNTKLTEEASPEPVVTEATATPEPKPRQTKKPKKKKEKPKETFDPFTVTKGDIEANFDEALKHVTICGKKLSFPFTLDDLGDEFDIDTEFYSFQYKEKENDLFADLTYRGKDINMICIKNGRLKGDIRKKPITSFEIFAWDANQIEFELCGVSLGVSEAYVNELWGVDKKNDWYYRKGGKKGAEFVCVSYDLDGILVAIEIDLRCELLKNNNKKRGK